MKLLKKSFLVLTSFLFVSGIYAKPNTETADVYAPTDLTSKMKTIRSKTSTKKTVSGVITEKKLTEKIILGEASMFMYSFTGLNMEIEEMKIFYDPVYKECGINYDKDRRFVSFDRKTLFMLKDAFEKYENEFDTQTLVTKRNKTVAKYGKIFSRYYRKEFLKVTDIDTKTTMGYVFVKNSPYFIVMLQPTEKVTNPIDREKNQKTPKISLAFNKNQMKVFLEATTQEKVDEAIAKTLAELNANAAEKAAAEEKSRSEAEAAAAASKKVEAAKIEVDLMKDLEKSEAAKKDSSETKTEETKSSKPVYKSSIKSSEEKAVEEKAVEEKTEEKKEKKTFFWSKKK